MPPAIRSASPLPPHIASDAAEASHDSPDNAHEGHASQRSGESSTPAYRPDSEHLNHLELSELVPPDTWHTLQRRGQIKRAQRNTDTDTVYAKLRVPAPESPETDTPEAPSAAVQSARKKLEDAIRDVVLAFSEPKRRGFWNAIPGLGNGNFGTAAATKELAEKLTGNAIGAAAGALWTAEQAAPSRSGRTASDAVSDHARNSVERALDALAPKQKAKLLHHLKGLDNVYTTVTRQAGRGSPGAIEVRMAVKNGLEGFMRKHGGDGEP
ncbi:hypothetical protein [Roseateles sp. MS654]|uniref:hypothetical protein n=1 Tax=Roseateles sp. MS654 TaxID=3412685 RepID=UPI003C2C5108